MGLLQGIEAVVVDAGGVLLLPDPEQMRNVVAALGVEKAPDDEQCRRAHYESMRELDRINAMDWVAVDRVLCETLGVPDELIDSAFPGMERIYSELAWVPIDGAAEALLTLEKQGMPIAVVSNASGTMERQLADHQVCSVSGDVCARVEIVVDSHVVGVEKPDPRIFTFALDQLGIGPERCLYVGDTVYFDVNGARAAGLHPVHLDPFGLCPHRDHPHVASLADVAAELA